MDEYLIVMLVHSKFVNVIKLESNIIYYIALLDMVNILN